MLLGSVISQDALTSRASGRVFCDWTSTQRYSVDVQDIFRAGDRVQSGIVSASQNDAADATVFLPGIGPVHRHERDANRQLGVVQLRAPLPDCRRCADDRCQLRPIDDPFVDEDGVNPKLGLMWRPTTHTTVRAAAFRTLFGSLTTSSAESAAAPRARAARRLHAARVRWHGRRGDVRGLASITS